MKSKNKTEDRLLPFPPRRNPFEKLVKDLTVVLNNAAEWDRDRARLELNRTKRAAAIWQSGYDETRAGNGEAVNPWKNAPNRIFWGYGHIAARMDLDPRFADVFRKIITDKQVRVETLGRD